MEDESPTGEMSMQEFVSEMLGRTDDEPRDVLKARERPINPTATSTRSMVPWSEFMRKMDDCPYEKLEALARQFVTAQREVFEPISRALVKEFQDAAEDDELAEALVLWGLRSGGLAAYASVPPSNNCYAIEPFVWHFLLDRDDALQAIENGIAPEQLSVFEAQSLERECASRPLFILKSQMNEFLKLKPSRKALREAARDIISEREKSHGTELMRKSMFVAELRSRFLGCSTNQAEEIWSSEVPPSWRKPGRRKPSEV